MLELYQYEDCPFCARVRRSLDEHGLDYLVRTEPRPRDQRKRVQALSGQDQVPVLVDPERQQVIVDSEEIVAYLDRHYKRKGP